MSKLIVTMTSWPKRIGNVKKVVESIMSNTVQPDILYLNLSTEEFKDEGDLPKDLVELFDSDERLIINFVEGENTKSMKKMFPILQYLDDEDIIMEMDDDFIAPKDLIECRLKDFNSYGGKHPITTNKNKASIGDTYIMAPTAMFSKKMVANWELFVDDTVLHTFNDDRTVLFIFWLNGYTSVPCTRYTSKGLEKNFSINQSNPLCGQYPVGQDYDNAVAPTVKELTGTDIRKAFNFFNRKKTVVDEVKTVCQGKFDVVIPWCHKGIASKMMECGDRLELEYVVASLHKYCSSWLGRIFIVGSEPPEQLKGKVIHIPCDDPYTHAKDANIIHKILFACENIPDLTDDFVKISDDQVLTRETSFEDLTPRIVRRYSDWTEQQWIRNRDMDAWHKGLYITLHRFDLTKCSFWEPHIASPINKHRWIEMCKKYNWEKSVGCIDMTLYYNFIEQPPVGQFDHLHLSRSQAQNILKTLEIKDIPRHLSWTDAAFSEKKFRDILEKICYD